MAYPSPSLAKAKVQARTHVELNVVVGGASLPPLTGLPYPPYIRAMVEETLCCRRLTPFSLPHVFTMVDSYEDIQFLIGPGGVRTEGCAVPPSWLLGSKGYAKVVFPGHEEWPYEVVCVGIRLEVGSGRVVGR